MFRGKKASNKYPTFKQVCSESKIQDGKHFTSKRHSETKQFPHQNRLTCKRCFLQHPYCLKVKKIPSVYLPQQALLILHPTIRNFNSSLSVFQDFKACYCSSPHKRYTSHYLSRQSTHCHRAIHRLSELYKTNNFSSRIPGVSNQLQKIHNDPNPKARILGLHNRLNLYDSCHQSRENSVNRIISPKASTNKRYHLNKTALKIHRPLHFSKICCLPSTSTLSVTSVPQSVPYNLKVHLSLEAITDLKWWADHLQFHSKTRIHITDPDLISTSDASDLGWGAWCREKLVQGLWQGFP